MPAEPLAAQPHPMPAPATGRPRPDLRAAVRRPMRSAKAQPGSARTTATLSTTVPVPTIARTARRDMPCCPESAGLAREFVAERLAAWQLSELVDVAVLLVSELFGNATRHTGCTRARVHVDRTGPVVRVGVRDSSGALPVLMAAGDTDENGRGLALVAKLAHRWGAVPEFPGKVVWFELRTDR